MSISTPAKWIEERIIAIVFSLLFVLIVSIFCALINTALSEKTTLIKDNWECDDYENVTTMMMVGKVLVPQVNIRCISYKKI